MVIIANQLASDMGNDECFNYVNTVILLVIFMTHEFSESPGPELQPIYRLIISPPVSVRRALDRTIQAPCSFGER